MIIKVDGKEEHVTCDICGDDIIPESFGWKYGNNPQPVCEGECCNHCNSTVVLPARFAMIRKDNELREVSST